MFGCLRYLVMCAAAGTVLSVLFLTPTGVVLGSVNGLLVGICMCLAELRAQRAEGTRKADSPLRLLGSP